MLVQEPGKDEAPYPAAGREPGSSEGDEPSETAIREELKRILSSRYFKTASRSRQFLQFVVDHRLAGQAHELKERTIGTEVFQRPVGYATGDDPIVRVQAGDVRRRLEQFYLGDGGKSTVRIELPVGSYCPEFRLIHAAVQAVEQATAETATGPVAAVASQQPPPQRRRFTRPYQVAVAAVAVLAVTLVALGIKHAEQRDVMIDFWSPVFSTPQPAFIFLAKGVTYRPSTELYERYRSTHPGEFVNEVEKSNDPLPLDPHEKLEWQDMRLYSDYGVARGDVYAVVRISGCLGKLGKPTQLRIGSDNSYQDLRNSPGVIIGAFNNKWAMHLLANLRFAFVEEGGRFLIREQIPNGRTWPLPSELTTVWGGGPGTSEVSGQTLDYAIVGRLMDSKTGQFTILAAGLTGAGTAAAGEFISSPELMERAFHDAPPDWRKRNSLIVLRTSVTEDVPGPPAVVASYFW